MKREDAESGLDFVGFIVFENKLKPTTADVLSEIREAEIGTVMVTGDNILTAISVSRKCGLMDKTAHCFVPRFIEGRHLWEEAERGTTALLTRLARKFPGSSCPSSMGEH